MRCGRWRAAGCLRQFRWMREASSCRGQVLSIDPGHEFMMTLAVVSFSNSVVDLISLQIMAQFSFGAPPTAAAAATPSQAPGASGPVTAPAVDRAFKATFDFDAAAGKRREVTVALRKDHRATAFTKRRKGGTTAT